VDGVVLEGQSAMDQSALTGESIPVAVAPGSRVAAATVNGSGFLKFQADRVGEDTTLSQIIHLVEEAGGSKAPIARLADKIAGVFVPVVMSIALLAAIVWAIAGQSFEFCLSTAIAVLVISCPCALGLATPVAIMVGTGRGAKLGILVKSAEALETLHSVDTVILDKTGTLTTGKPVLTDLLPEHVSQQELLTVAYALEQPSEHPLAEAVCALAKQWEIPLKPAANFTSVPGRGVQGEVDGQLCLGGNLEFLQENGISLDPAAFEALAQAGKTVVYFARSGKFLGAAAAMDVAKPDSKAAVEAMKALGITPVMVTGDNRRTALALAETLGIDQVEAQVLPQDKERIVRQLQESGHKVAMIGDGINDSPALTRADVGIAIGAGTDIAMESSDIVLMRSSLMDAAAAVELSRAVMGNIRMNLFWAFFYNTLGIPVAAGVLYPAFGLKLSPMIGAAAMSLSSVCVVTNALRLRFWSPKIAQAQPGETAQTLPINLPAPPEKGEPAMKTVLNIQGMMCQHCVAHVTKALQGVPGVETVDVSLEQNQAAVTGSADPAALTAAVVDAGYEVTGIQ
jgi:heavy metal translocating P-type ATPase